MFTKKKQKTDSEKKYLKYKDGEVKEFNSEDEVEEFTNQNKEEHKATSMNLKSKLLIGVGLTLILAPLIISGIAKGGAYIKEYKNFMVLGTEKPSTDVDKETSDKLEPENIQKPIDKKFTEAEIEAINNAFNKELNNWYAYLKTDIVNYKKGVESVYSTQKNLEYKLTLTEKAFSKFKNRQAEFVKKGATDLYNAYLKRMEIYTKGVNTMLGDLNRVYTVEVFNSILDIDKKESVRQEQLLKKYLNN